ncbi:hypothetical protein [Helicovermis profundi]|uniref:Flagellar hook-length control protein-like C-terminal domain-containing protein n=1 Tax=Helicovermis profundi TaxID=3065157 RepID=A0AAU9E8F6_9FIRM|nr:hypothetical protein HLPR_03630 [Clostridia bacterium S502]
MKIANSFLNKLNILNSENKNNSAKKNIDSDSSFKYKDIINNLQSEKQSGIKEALRKMDRANISVDKTSANEVNNFLKNSKGSLESKLKTIDMAISKDVDLTEKNLSSMNSAINSEANKADMIESLTNSSSEDIANLKNDDAIKAVNKLNLDDNIKEKIISEIKNGSSLKEATVKVLESEYGLKIDLKGEMNILINDSGKESKIISFKDMLKLVKRLEKLKSIVDSFDMEKLKKLIVNSNITSDKLIKSLDKIISLSESNTKILENSKGDLLKNEVNIILNGLKNISDDVNLIVKETENKLDSIGENKELDNIENMYNNDETKENDFNIKENELEKNLENIENFIDEINNLIADDSNVLNNFIDESNLERKSDVKMFLRKEITAKIIEVKDEFQKSKSLISDNLEKAVNSNATSKEKITDIISKAIEKLDNIVMKSDINLYTSMKNERDLIKMSSDLSDALKYLNKGDKAKSLSIIKNVKKSIDKIIFDPSIKRVEVQLNLKAKELLSKQNIETTLNTKNEVGAREIVELMRSLGLNHEYEVSEKMYYNKDMVDNLEIKDNLKMALLKILSDEKLSNTIVESAKEMLGDLTGEQLLNKNNLNAQKETLIFNIPITLYEKKENVKMYVNSNKKGGRIDWKNCSLYFVLDLQRYGETGIKIDINDKNINVTVSNDNDEIVSKVDPLVDNLFNEFKSVGFNPVKINYKKLNIVNKDNKKNNTKTEEKIQAKNEGFDFKI